MARFLSTQRPVTPLPYWVYYLVILGLTLIGLLTSLYLSISHYRVYTDIGYRSFCAISRAINCDTVSQSKFSVFMGLPVPIWGVIGYTVVLLLLPLAMGGKRDKTGVWPMLFVLSLLYSCYSVVLAFISTYFIQSYCIMCIVTYGVNFLILFYAWLIRKRFGGGKLMPSLATDTRLLWRNRGYVSSWLVPIVLLIFWAIPFFPKYWDLKPPAYAGNIATGLTSDGHPWIGAENPKLVITEYTDYLCFQCKKMHFYLRELIAKYPDKVRLIHRHFPMDRDYNPLVKEPFHIGSGKMALLAIAAAQEGKFWEANDYLFALAGKRKSIDIREFADRLGLKQDRMLKAVIDPQTIRMLQADIQQGLKLNISGTPGYVVDNQVYLGTIPADVLTAVVD
jgi:protein-disulfide isomerase/uncharacterized membrane protein